jgi:hypothetical protein
MTSTRQPTSSESEAITCSLSDFVIAICEAQIGWISDNIHPHVTRSPKDTNASYLRKMALWAMAANTFPVNDHAEHHLGVD